MIIEITIILALDAKEEKKGDTHTHTHIEMAKCVWFGCMDTVFLVS